MKKLSSEIKKEICDLMDEKEAVLFVKLNEELLVVTSNFGEERDKEKDVFLVNEFVRIALNTIKFYKPDNDIAKT